MYWFTYTVLALALSAMFWGRIHASNVLFFSGIGEGSHFTAASMVAEELAGRGHSVTFVLGSAFKFRMEHPLHSKLFKFKLVEMHETFEDVSNRFEPFITAVFAGETMVTQFKVLGEIHEHFIRDCNKIFQDDFLTFFQESNFDMVVFDPSWPCSNILAGYAVTQLTVAVFPPCIVPVYVRYHGNPLNPAVTPETGSGLPVEMAFLQRVSNVLYTYMYEVLETIPSGYDEIRKRIGVDKSKRDVFRDAALLLSASDPLVDQRIPVMPHHILVGGLTVEPAKPLQSDLEKFMQSSGEHGVILFSLGSYVTQLPDKFVKLFQEAFAKLPQKVIWQWKGKAPPINMPENVKTMSWLPQNDLLGHNKTRMMFYQGGNNGLYEAVYHAVPLLVLPLLGDQPDIAQRVVEKGIGLKLDVTKITSNSVFESIKSILENPSYQNNINKLSVMFRDRPDTPRERAAFWIEHVLKYGADHLRSPVHDLNFIQLNMIDVHAFLMSCLLLIFTITYHVTKFVFLCLYKGCCGKKLKAD